MLERSGGIPPVEGQGSRGAPLRIAISTLIGHRPAIPYVRVLSSQQHNNLIPVTLTSNPLICPTTTASLSITNARSFRHETTILDHIHEHHLNGVAITETWLTNKDSDLPVTSVVDFFKEFADILDTYATLPDELVIVGDFNFHFDINTDVHVRHFCDILYSHDMTQHDTVCACKSCKLDPIPIHRPKAN